MRLFSRTMNALNVNCMGNKSQLRYPLLAGCEQFWDKPVGQNPEAEPVGQNP